MEADNQQRHEILIPDNILLRLLTDSSFQQLLTRQIKGFSNTDQLTELGFVVMFDLQSARFKFLEMKDPDAFSIGIDPETNDEIDEMLQSGSFAFIADSHIHSLPSFVTSEADLTSLITNRKRAHETDLPSPTCNTVSIIVNPSGENKISLLLVQQKKEFLESNIEYFPGYEKDIATMPNITYLEVVSALDQYGFTAAFVTLENGQFSPADQEIIKGFKI